LISYLNRCRISTLLPIFIEITVIFETSNRTMAKMVNPEPFHFGHQLCYNVYYQPVPLMRNRKGKVQQQTRKPSELSILKQRIARLEAAESSWGKTQSALKESEKNYKDLVEKAGICILIDDRDGNLVYFNEKLSELLGYRPDELKNKPIRFIIHPADISRVLAYHHARISGKKAPARYEFRGLRKNGSAVDLEVDATVLKKNGKIIGSRSYIWDIGERKKSEKIASVSHEISKAINESPRIDMLYPQIHKILWKVIDATNFFIALYDKQSDVIRFTYFTDEYDDEPEIRNASQSGSLTAEVILKGKTLLMTQRELKSKYKIPKEEWGTQPEIWLGIPLKYKHEVIGVMATQSYINAKLFSAEDIEILESVSETIAFAIQRKIAEDEKQKLAEKLRQAQKMEALGTMAGGIAHDFNNILGVIMGYTDLLLRDMKNQHPAREKLGKIMKASLRAKELVSQILAFSRKSDKNIHPLYIGKILSEAVSFLEHSLPATIRVCFKIAKYEGLVMANSDEFRQIVMNICTNSAQAIGNREGEIKIRLEETYLPAESTADLSSGYNRFMCTSISDTGSGIPENVIDRIFEPYFTTKKSKKGSGMGLAVVHGIVKGYGGMVTVKSKPGGGTTFKIYLPIIGTDKMSAVNTETPDKIVGGKERILYVDDELDLAHLGKLMLSKLGYQVIYRTSSSSALETFRKNPEAFDLIITDMTMPRMTGIQLARGIHKIKPGIPVIVCTGYNEQLEHSDSNMEGISVVITKPLNLTDLARAIRQVLDSTPGRSG
jgi:PAS domain S-box-containing protein